MFILPVPHDKFSTKTPWVIVGIAVLDALLLIPILGNGGQAFLQQFGFTPSNPTLLTLFSGMFLHVGLWHYIGNMFFFWIFGRKIESTLGHGYFLLAYLLSGIGGQFLYWITATHSTIPCVGASGAIAGVAGLYFIIFPNDRFDLNIYLGWWKVKTVLSNARVAVGVWIGEQFILGLLTAIVSFSSTAFWAHVGGFVAGAALGEAYRTFRSPDRRPVFVTHEMPTDDEIEQPNPLVGLNLSPASAPIHRSTDGEN